MEVFTIARYAGSERIGSAYEDFPHKVAPLSIETSELRAILGPLESLEVPQYLRKLGYNCSVAGNWPEEVENGTRRPKLILGHINGHVEEHGHTWYNMHCHLKIEGTIARHWCVPRRLQHLRLLLHDPIKSALGPAYRKHFKNARFASHGAPSGTTDTLVKWLSTLSNIINQGVLIPSLVALTLRFLEAPALFEEVDTESSALRESAVASSSCYADGTATAGRHTALETVTENNRLQIVSETSPSAADAKSEEDASHAVELPTDPFVGVDASTYNFRDSSLPATDACEVVETSQGTEDPSNPAELGTESIGTDESDEIVQDLL
eukprot:TRINITY_DN25707_c0_g1_i1.p1 TRINITY_DN25707_c0_g1~~TRINITY_DN25707_c0_g1_i1.p1  ORF type:complete len:323 (-),score=47.76 TRINITY_DN25707_c0_g1_i1:6-974(-)